MSRPALPTVEVDTARLPLLPGELRLPAIDRLWAEMAEHSDQEIGPSGASVRAGHDRGTHVVLDANILLRFQRPNQTERENEASRNRSPRPLRASLESAMVVGWDIPAGKGASTAAS